MCNCKSISIFLGSTRDRKIVIADATGGTLLDSNEVLLLKQINVDVEQISYYQDEQQLRLKGKRYGEGKLLSLAKENSIMLKTVDSFLSLPARSIAEILKQE